MSQNNGNSSDFKMSTPTDYEERMNNVFGNELLREKILDFAIHNGKKLSFSNIQTCRLVHSSWLRSVTKCLRRSREPLFAVEAPSLEESKSLNEFIQMIGNLVCGDGLIPPIDATIWRNYFDNKSFQSLVDFLSCVGSGLISLFVGITTGEGCSEQITSSGLDLPILQSFDIFFYHRDVDKNSITTSFIQVILSGCRELKRFTTVADYIENEEFPLDFGNLCLPISLTNLDLCRGLGTNHLKKVMRRSLPKLMDLSISFTHQPFDDDVIFMILNKFCDTLKSLAFGGIEESAIPDFLQTQIQLPRMKVLKTLAVLTGNVRWPHDAPPSQFESKLPVLETIKFENQSVTSFRNWTERSKFESVKIVHVHVEVGIGVTDNDRGTVVLECTTLMRRAFPNIRKLVLVLDMTLNVFGLQHVFQNFQQLEELELWISNKKKERFSEADWISLFLGIPKKLAEALRKTKEFWENVLFMRDRVTSITKMTELRLLRLTYNYDCHSPITFDAVFYFGLMKMPNLREVQLHEKFQVSSETAKNWRDDGRMLKFHRV